MLPLQIQLSLPPWIGEVADAQRRYEDDEARVALAIELARQNVVRDTGGPFGAAVFEADSGQLIAAAVNCVVPGHCSLAHAETTALMLAQQRLERHRLNQPDGRYVLATSAQPCCQCYGALVWAGIDELLIGARADDVEQLAGFDEGPLPPDWDDELQRRGITIRQDILREQARGVLIAYRAGGTLY